LSTERAEREWAARREAADRGLSSDRLPMGAHAPKYFWIGCSDQPRAGERDATHDGRAVRDRQPCQSRPPQDAKHVRLLQSRHVIKVKTSWWRTLRLRRGSAEAVGGSATGSSILVHRSARSAHDHRARARKNLGERSALEPQLCELNLMRQVTKVAADVCLQEAGRAAELSVHGWIYALDDGVGVDMGIDSDSDRGPE